MSIKASPLDSPPGFEDLESPNIDDLGPPLAPPPERIVFSDLRDVIRNSTELQKQYSEEPLAEKFFSSLQSLQETPMGQQALSTIEKSNLVVRLVLNREYLNRGDVRCGELFIDPVHPYYLIVCNDGLRYLKQTLIMITIYHEILHLLYYLEHRDQYVENRDSLPSDEWHSWEEVYVICGKGRNRPSENDLRKFLGEPIRVGHSGSADLIDFSHAPAKILTDLALKNLTGELMIYLEQRKITLNDVIQSELIPFCVKNRQWLFLKILFRGLKKIFPDFNENTFMQEQMKTKPRTEYI